MRQWMLGLALAVPALTASASSMEEVGTQTRAMLELQRSGNAALGTVRPMSGEVADKVYQRYLNSFSHPIPETFSRDQFVSGSGSSR